MCEHTKKHSHCVRTQSIKHPHSAALHLRLHIFNNYKRNFANAISILFPTSNSKQRTNPTAKSAFVHLLKASLSICQELLNRSGAVRIRGVPHSYHIGLPHSYIGGLGQSYIGGVGHREISNQSKRKETPLAEGQRQR